MRRLALMIASGALLLGCQDDPPPPQHGSQAPMAPSGSAAAAPPSVAAAPPPGAAPAGDTAPPSAAAGSSFVFAGFSKDSKRFAYTSGSASGAPMSFLWTTEAGSTDATTLALMDPADSSASKEAEEKIKEGGYIPARRPPPSDLTLEAHLTDTPPTVTLTQAGRTRTATIEKCPFPPTDKAELWGVSPDGKSVAIHIGGPVVPGLLSKGGPGRVEFYRIVPLP